MIKYGKSITSREEKQKDILFEKVSTLLQAFPYLQKFTGRKVVIKVGGELLLDKEASLSFAKDIVLLKSIGIQVIICHGGGPQISNAMKEFGIEPQFINGLRITDEKTLKLTSMILHGSINRELVSLINSIGNHAIGISGIDANIITVKKASEELGFVGNVKMIHAEPLLRIVNSGYIPVISCIGTDGKGSMYNVNADEVCGQIAKGVEAEKLLIITNIEGIYENFNDKETLITEIDSYSLKHLRKKGKFEGSIIPKVDAVITALEGGVSTAHILDGRLKHSVLLEIFTSEGIGTMIYP